MTGLAHRGRAGRIESTDYPRQGVAVLKLVGEFDIATVPRVTEQLRQLPLARLQHVVFDLQGVSFLSASGVRMLVTTFAESGHSSTQVHLVGLTDDEQLQRMLSLLHMPRHLRQHATVHDALHELDQEANNERG